MLADARDSERRPSSATVHSNLQPNMAMKDECSPAVLEAGAPWMPATAALQRALQRRQ